MKIKRIVVDFPAVRAGNTKLGGRDEASDRGILVPGASRRTNTLQFRNTGLLNGFATADLGLNES